MDELHTREAFSTVARCGGTIDGHLQSAVEGCLNRTPMGTRAMPGSRRIQRHSQTAYFSNSPCSAW